MIWFFVLIAGTLGGAGGLYWFWARRVRAEIAEGAAAAFDRISVGEPEFLAGLPRERFAAAYGRAHFPRFPKYLLTSLAAFAVALPVVFAVLSFALWVGDQTGLVAEPAELAKYVPLGEGRSAEARANREEMALYLARDFAGFYYFFGVTLAWIAILAIVMRMYHKRRPGPLREELLREKERPPTGVEGPSSRVDGASPEKEL